MGDAVKGFVAAIKPNSREHCAEHMARSGQLSKVIRDMFQNQKQMEDVGVIRKGIETSDTWFYKRGNRIRCVAGMMISWLIFSMRFSAIKGKVKESVALSSSSVLHVICKSFSKQKKTQLSMS